MIIDSREISKPEERTEEFDLEEDIDTWMKRFRDDPAAFTGSVRVAPTDCMLERLIELEQHTESVQLDASSIATSELEGSYESDMREIVRFALKHRYTIEAETGLAFSIHFTPGLEFHAKNVPISIRINQIESSLDTPHWRLLISHSERSSRRHSASRSAYTFRDFSELPDLLFNAIECQTEVCRDRMELHRSRMQNFQETAELLRENS